MTTGEKIGVGVLVVLVLVIAWSRMAAAKAAADVKKPDPAAVPNGIPGRSAPGYDGNILPFSGVAPFSWQR